MLFSRRHVRDHVRIPWTFAFFSLIFLAYIATLNPLVWGDTVASRYLPLSIIRELNFDLNEFNFPYDRDIPYFVQYRAGRLISSYPIGASLTALPFYLIPVLFGISHQSPWIPLLEKFSAASIVVLSAFFLYLTLRWLTTERTSLVVTGIYAFCTSAFSVSSQALWQHGPSQLFLAIGLYFVIRGLQEETSTSWSGFPFGAAILCRPTDVLMVLPIVIYLCLHRRNSLVLWVLCALPPVAFLLAYNYYYFGSIFNSGYGTNVLRPLSSYWSTPLFYGLSGVLLSPSKGMFIYSPVFLFSFIGIYLSWRRNNEVLFEYISIGPILVLVLYSKWHFWWGGETYGPRLVVDITPFFCLYIYHVWDSAKCTNLARMIIVMFSIVSFLMHSVDAFCFDYSWYKKAEIMVEDDRLWSFRDSPFFHYGRMLYWKNFSILRTSLSRVQTSPQFPHLLQASITHGEVPSHQMAGEPIRLHVTAINTGNAVWLFQTNNGQYGVRMGWKWFEPDGEVPLSEGRAPIRRDIFPGEYEELNIEIWPPSVGRKYRLELGMVSEPGTWFSVEKLQVEVVGSCRFEDVIGRPVKFIRERPNITITPDQPSYLADEIATVHLSIVNGSIPRNLKLVAFLRYPDGHLRSLGSSTELLPNPPCSQWIGMSAPHILSKGFRIDWQFGLQLRDMGSGAYGLYALLIEPASVEIVSKSSSIFYIREKKVDENETNFENFSVFHLEDY
jgi:Dolichyl-phosphate-mannose-protein mannosyltransferase